MTASIAVDAGGVWVQPMSESPSDSVSQAESVAVTLVQAIPKGSKLEAIVRATTEIGVQSIRLMYAERCVSRWGSDRAASRLERLRRVSEQAARQCGRSVVPEISAPEPADRLWSQAPSETSRWLCHPHPAPLEAMNSAAAAAPGVGASRSTRAHDVWVTVGPEGGFSDAEVAAARACGWTPVALGSNVLRVETAAIVAVALAADRLSALETPSWQQD